MTPSGLFRSSDLHVMLRWAENFGVALSEKPKPFKAEMEKRAAVCEALSAEGLA